MMRETMPLSEALGHLADMHEAETDRLEAWVMEVAPQIAAELGIPADRLQPVLDAYLANHLAVLREMVEQDGAELAAAGPNT